MAPWLTIDEYRRQFQPPPNRKTVLSWSEPGGPLERYQPGGRGGRIYVRPREDGRPESEHELREALHAAETAQRRQRRA